MAHVTHSRSGPHGRIIFIGDIHGCATELESLLKILAPTQADTLVSVGDLINKGPDSPRVLAMAREHAILPILGNHEMRMLNAHLQKSTKSLKAGDKTTFKQLSEVDIDWIKSWPLVRHFPTENLLTVHGGFLPGIPWNQQSADVVTRIQVIDPSGKPAKRNEAPECPSWAESWEGQEFVVYGHTPRKEPIRHKRAIGIDTGCVYGGSLTAWVYPHDTLHSVQSRKAWSSANSF